jgi:hypothetical protein
MEEEIKKVEEETTAEPTPAQETNEATPEVEAEAKTEEVAEPDYKALLEAERKRVKQAEYTLKKLNMERKNADVEQLDEGAIEEIINQKVEEKLNARLSDFSTDIFEDELMKSSTDADERELIRLKYDNVINKSGFTRQAIRDDVANAKLLANAPKYLKASKELAETLKAKAAITNLGSSSNQQSAVGEPDNLRKHFTETDWVFMKKRGWSDEQIKKAIPPKR